jgi:hypothetical protein
VSEKPHGDAPAKKSICGRLLGYFAGNEVECNRELGHDGAHDHSFAILGEADWIEVKQILAAETSKKEPN